LGRDKVGALSFVLEGPKIDDVGAALSRDDIAVERGIIAQPSCVGLAWRAPCGRLWRSTNNTTDIDAVISTLRRLTRGAWSRAAMPHALDSLP
jgi:hypothetical protein